MLILGGAAAGCIVGFCRMELWVIGGLNVGSVSGNTLHGVPSHVFAQKLNTSWVYIDPLHYPSFSWFFPTLKLLDFPFFLISPHCSRLCRNWKLLKRSQSWRSMILRPHVGLFTYSGNSCSLEFGGSPPLVRQTQSKWISLESWKWGGSDGVDSVGVFGELGTLCCVERHFHSFSISNYIVCHFSLSGLHRFSPFFCPLARQRPIFTLCNFHMLF